MHVFWTDLRGVKANSYFILPLQSTDLCFDDLKNLIEIKSDE